MRTLLEEKLDRIIVLEDNLIELKNRLKSLNDNDTDPNTPARRRLIEGQIALIESIIAIVIR